MKTLNPNPPAPMVENVVRLTQQSFGVQKTVVLFHAISGTLFPYRKFIAELPDTISCIGLEADGLDGRRLPLSSVRALARRYANHLALYVERGDVQLVGWSFGGCIAYEVGNIIGARGLHRIRIVAIDTAFLRSSPGQLSNPAPLEAALDAPARFSSAWYSAVRVANLAALNSYIPAAAKPDIPVLVVEAAQSEELGYSNPHGRFPTAKIVADHYSILEPPAVSFVAKLVSQW